MVPGYSGGVGAAWLEKGGVYVVANIRGGGEFGPTWHQAALKANRHKAYEDFIAVAEDLDRAQGHLDAAPRHPGRQQRRPADGQHAHACGPTSSGRVVCQVPLLDMRRYHTLLAGASWMGEYGDPDDPKEWAFIQDVLAVPQREGRREVPADALHDLDARRPRPPRPRAQDGGADEASRGRTSSTTRTSRAATAAPPTTSRRPTWRRWPTRSCGRSCGRLHPESARAARPEDPQSPHRVPGSLGARRGDAPRMTAATAAPPDGLLERRLVLEVDELLARSCPSRSTKNSVGKTLTEP